MKSFIFLLGGARSGKSGYAVELAKKLGEETAFIATASASDREMAERIELHKKARPSGWKVYEERKDIGLVLERIGDTYGTVLIDCFGIFISNLMEEGLDDEDIERTIKKLIETMNEHNSTVIIVSNEVGSGIVPVHHLSRRFRDILGSSNCLMADRADKVVSMQAGVPVTIKGEAWK